MALGEAQHVAAGGGRHHEDMDKASAAAPAEQAVRRLTPARQVVDCVELGLGAVPRPALAGRPGAQQAVQEWAPRMRAGGQRQDRAGGRHHAHRTWCLAYGIENVAGIAV